MISIIIFPKSHTPFSLVVAMETKPSTLDPRWIGGDVNAQYLEELLFLPLVSFDPQGEHMNVIAESIDSQDGKVWRIKLKKGVFFGNGQEITSLDVVATYQYFLGPLAPRRSSFKDVILIKEINAYELEIHLKAPYVAFPTNLTIGILPKDIFTQKEISLSGLESGPYKSESQEDDKWFFVPNPRYKKAVNPWISVPKIPLTIKFIPDPMARLSVLMNGDADLLQRSLDMDRIYFLQNQSQYHLNIDFAPSLETTYLAFKMDNPQVSSLEVRRKLKNSLNIPEILKALFHGYATEAKGMFPSVFPYFYSSHEDLNTSGSPGELDDMTLTLSTARESQIVAKVLQAQWKEAGVNIKLTVLEPSLFQKVIQNGGAMMWLGSWIGYKDPDHLRFVFHSESIPPFGGNRGRFRNAKVDKALKLGMVSLNHQLRKSYYNEAQEELNRNIPYIYLWHRDNFVIMSQQIKNFQIFRDGRYLGVTQVEKNEIRS